MRGQPLHSGGWYASGRAAPAAYASTACHSVAGEVVLALAGVGHGTSPESRPRAAE